MRELVFAVLLVVASAAIVTGAAMLSLGAGWITFGMLLAVWSWLIFGEVEAQ